ncbi:protein piccolo [Caerostris extrusa]|uniref:Protein piccolo n=1 Tax=Caerostris extrusa TaxID=172846 RepID=A0AAV4Q7S9_CAEEX|nr:protein piccolo [Caerostris extrusa]
MLHEELCKLAERRDRMEAGRTTPVAYVPSPTGSVAYRTSEQTLVAQTRPVVDNDDTSSVLKAIDEILRKDLYSGPLSRTAAWTNYGSADARSNDFYQSAYVTMPRNRYEYSVNSDVHNMGGQWYEEEQVQQQQQQQQVGYYQETAAVPESAMDESIARIASTFPTDEPPDILLSATPGHFSPESEMAPAMPLLPDMPTRSRKLLENLGSSPIQPSRSGSAQSLYQDHHRSEDESNEDDSLGHRMQESSSLLRSQRKLGKIKIHFFPCVLRIITVDEIRFRRITPRTPVSKTTQKYEFPVKRILLTRDPKDRSVSGNGLGMKVVGGKEVPGSNGMIGAYVAKIFPGELLKPLGEVKEGDQVLEWNGIPLTGRTYEEVQRIIASSADEVEIVIRCDLNMLETMNRQRRSSPGMGDKRRLQGRGFGSNGPFRRRRSGKGSSPLTAPTLLQTPLGVTVQHSPRERWEEVGGGNIVSNNIRNALTANLSQASSYENIQSPDRQDSGLISRGQTSRSVVSVFAPGPVSTDFSELYEPSYFSSPPSPDDFLEDEFQYLASGVLRSKNGHCVCTYHPKQTFVKECLPPFSTGITSRDEDEYEPLLKTAGGRKRRTLGFYDLLRPRCSLDKAKKESDDNNNNSKVAATRMAMVRSRESHTWVRVPMPPLTISYPKAAEDHSALSFKSYNYPQLRLVCLDLLLPMVPCTSRRLRAYFVT